MVELFSSFSLFESIPHTHTCFFYSFLYLFLLRSFVSYLMRSTHYTSDITINYHNSLQQWQRKAPNKKEAQIQSIRNHLLCETAIINCSLNDLLCKLRIQAIRKFTYTFFSHLHGIEIEITNEYACAHTHAHEIPWLGKQRFSIKDVDWFVVLVSFTFVSTKSRFSCRIKS